MGKIIKFKEWLNESPLQHYGYDFHSENDPDEGFFKDKAQSNSAGGQTDEWDKFSKRDKALISHPKTFKTLEDKLRKSSFNFIILLIEQPLSKIYNYRNRRSEYERQIRYYLSDNNINIQNSIVFAKDSTSGHLLTPWMILHTIGHALADSPYFMDEIQNLVWEIDGLSKDNVGKVFAFKSAKEYKIPNRVELINELIAEFLWSGKIRINPEIVSLEWAEEIKSKVLKLEEQIKDCLSLCVGKIIIDKLN